MKKIFFIFSIISLGMLSSCSKDDTNVLTETPSLINKQKVVLNITNINDANNYTRSTTEADPTIKKVIYAVYKTGDGITSGNEELVLKDNVEVGSTPVSAISLDLQPGKYLIAVFASGRTNAEMKTYEETGKTILKNSYLNTSDLTSPTEFYGTTNIEVVSQSVNANVTLQRLVGKVEIVIKDLNSLPTSITSATPVMKTYTISSNWADIAPSNMRMTNIDASIFRLSDLDQPNPFDQLTLSRSLFSAHNENNPIVFYCMQTATNFSAENFRYSTPFLYIHLNPQNGNPSNTILITPQLKVYPNKITRFTGTIVGQNNQGFTMSVVDQWGNDTETVIVDKVL